MLKTSRGLLATALLGLLVAGCTPSGVIERAADDDPARLLEQAQQQEPTQAATTRLEAATILARRGERTQALEVLRTFDHTQLPAEHRLPWAMLQSELGEELDEPRAVIQAAQVLDQIELPQDAELILRQRLGLAFAQRDDHIAAAEQLLYVQARTDQEALNDAIWASLSRLDISEISRLYQDADEHTQGWLNLARLVRDSDGDVERLLARLDTWRERHSQHPAARQVPTDLLALRELRGQEVRHIAVFLPESGPLSSVADSIRTGMRAQHLHSVERSGGLRLTFLDSQHGNLEALYAEAQSIGAQVVIGPLAKDLVTELEGHDSVPLPTLALNYGDNPSNRANRLFQYGLSAEDEARQVARRGREDGHRSSALLVPSNEWGNRVGRAFTEAWSANGGSITNSVAYNPQGAATESARQAVSGGRPDMLFLLALPSYARQVPPNLDYIGASDLPIYATSHLYEGRPQPLLDHDLDDVTFVDIPWQIPDAAVGGVEALPYLDSYQELQPEADPSTFRLTAMGVDAYELARRLPQLQLLPESEYHGATGRLVAGPDGRVQRWLPWARFERGVPRPILSFDLLDGMSTNASGE